MHMHDAELSNTTSSICTCVQLWFTFSDMMMRSFAIVIFTITLSSVMATQSKSSLPWQQEDFTTISTGKVEDIMNVVILDAGTPEEKEMIAANVKVMISNITELAKCAVAVLNRNKVLLSKAANLIETAKDMLGESEELGAMELMQTILLAKIQDMIMDADIEDKSMENEVISNKKADMDSSGDTDLEVPNDDLIKKNAFPTI